VTTVRPCAHDCGLVAALIRDLARAKGTTEQTERIRQGLHSPADKAPGLSSPVHKRTGLLALTQQTRLVPEDSYRYEQPIDTRRTR
jgi:hypothetical protein